MMKFYTRSILVVIFATCMLEVTGYQQDSAKSFKICDHTILKDKIYKACSHLPYKRSADSGEKEPTDPSIPMVHRPQRSRILRVLESILQDTDDSYQRLKRYQHNKMNQAFWELKDLCCLANCTMDDLMNGCKQ